jgi:hypothetical protein
VINYIKPIDETPACECGAALERFRCLKCWAWDRWVRRQAAKRRTVGKRSGQTWRPANRPRGIVEAGVIWT